MHLEYESGEPCLHSGGLIDRRALFGTVGLNVPSILRRCSHLIYEHAGTLHWSGNGKCGKASRLWRAGYGALGICLVVILLIAVIAPIWVAQWAHGLWTGAVVGNLQGVVALGWLASLATLPISLIVYGAATTLLIKVLSMGLPVFRNHRIGLYVAAFERPVTKEVAE